MRTLLSIAAVLGIGAFSWGAVDAWDLIPFEGIEAEGLRVGSVPAGNLVLRDGGELAEFWDRYGSGPQPSIDFERRMVVGVFLGERPNPGYGVRIVAVRRVGTGAEVVYEESLPHPDGIYAQVIVHPSDLVSIPRVSGQIRFAPSD